MVGLRSGARHTAYCWTSYILSCATMRTHKVRMGDDKVGSDTHAA